MPEPAIHALVRNLIDGDIDSAVARISPAWHDGSKRPHEPTPVELWRLFGSAVLGAFSERQIDLRDLVVDGDTVSGAFTFSGDQTGALFGHPPCDKHLSAGGAFSARLEDGLLVINLVDVPVMDTLVETGLIPPAELRDRPLVYPVVLPDALLKLLFNGGFFEKPCSHLHDIRFTEPETRACVACDEEGTEYPATRMCLICGHVGCCDASKNKHARKHFEQTGHPLIRSLRLTETWMWCYADSTVLSERG